MYGSLAVRMYESPSGRTPVREFLDGLPAHSRAAIMSDVQLVATHGRMAPVSVKPIKGPRNRGLYEIRTSGYRTFYCVVAEVMWLLHACRKQDQAAGIDVARERMRRVA
jgi:phage-related protein